MYFYVHDKPITVNLYYMIRMSSISPIASVTILWHHRSKWLINHSHVRFSSFEAYLTVWYPQSWWLHLHWSSWIHICWALAIPASLFRSWRPGSAIICDHYFEASDAEQMSCQLNLYPRFPTQSIVTYSYHSLAFVHFQKLQEVSKCQWVWVKTVRRSKRMAS